MVRECAFCGGEITATAGSVLMSTGRAVSVREGPEIVYAHPKCVLIVIDSMDDRYDRLTVFGAVAAGRVAPIVNLVLAERLSRGVGE
jgi:hypothetical protein